MGGDEPGASGRAGEAQGRGSGVPDIRVHVAMLSLTPAFADTLLNVFLAIAVDNLANAQELTKVELVGECCCAKLPPAHGRSGPCQAGGGVGWRRGAGAHSLCPGGTAPGRKAPPPPPPKQTVPDQVASTAKEGGGGGWLRQQGCCRKQMANSTRVPVYREWAVSRDFQGMQQPPG